MAEMLRDRFRIAPAVRAAARGMFRTPEAPVSETSDHRRLQRIAEHEEDKQLLTEVERYDSEMLDRVRSALYDS